MVILLVWNPPSPATQDLKFAALVRNKITHAEGQLGPCGKTAEPDSWGSNATHNPRCRLPEPSPQNRRSAAKYCNEKPAHCS